MDQILFIIKQIKKRKILIPHTYHTEKYTSSSPNMTARLSIFPAGQGELPWILTQMLPPSLPFLFSAIMPFCYSILRLPDMTWRVLYTHFNYFPRYPQPKPKYYIYLLSYQNHKKNIINMTFATMLGFTLSLPYLLTIRFLETPIITKTLHRHRFFIGLRLNLKLFLWHLW